MARDVTVEIVVHKTYQLEVPDDFDFEDYEALQDLAKEADDTVPFVTEDWDAVYVTDDETGVEYAA